MPAPHGVKSICPITPLLFGLPLSYRLSLCDPVMLKGEIVKRGVRDVLGLDMPVFPKRRFQHGAVAEHDIERLFPKNEARYRRHFEKLHAAMA